MKKLIYILVLVLLSLSGTIFAQVTEEWAVRYNGPGNNEDEAFCIVVDGFGNVYVAGLSTGSGTNYDYATIKYNSEGVQQWIARYNGPGNNIDWVGSIAVDGRGNVYVTGCSYGSGTNDDYATIKYNSAGVQQWVSRYNGPGNLDDRAFSLAIDHLGNVFVTGFSTGSGTMSDYATIKYDSTGVQKWVSRYNGPSDSMDIAHSLVIDGSGNVYVTGSSKGSGTNLDYATIKYNSEGVQQWSARYNGPGNDVDEAFSIAVDSLGNIFVTGGSTGSGTNLDYATIKYNSAGAQQWVARYNGPGNNIDIASPIVVDGSGYVYLTGLSFGSGTNCDYATIKYNSAGVPQWTARYNGPGNDVDEVSFFVVDDSGNVYVTGGSIGSGTNLDYATLKYNSAGAQQWVARYNGTGNGYDYSSALAVDGSGNVYVAGYSMGSGTSYDCVTIKYSQQVGIQNISTEIPSAYSLSQNYPNPFNPTTKIKFDVVKVKQASLLVTLKVYDALGREVQTLVNERLNAGTYETTFDGSMLPSGVYFCTLITDSFKKTRRLLLIK